MPNIEMVKKCEESAKNVRLNILEMTYNTGKTGAHLGGSLSIVELLVGLYLGNIKYDSNNPDWEDRDRVILSKGHAALALYPTLVEAGIIDEKELSTFKKDGSKLGGHPSLNGLPGIEFASGSLGQGLSLGVGVGLALQRKENDSSRVFVFLGDGECDEGSIWEAAASASHYGLNQLVAIVDTNQIQYDGYTKDVLDMDLLENKWKEFGWDVLRIDGHNMQEVLDAYEHKTNKPLAIIGETVKGKGVSFMENNWKYHNSILSKSLYEEAMEEVRG